MSEPLRNALLYLITTVFELYLSILIIRVILAYAGTNYFDPVVRFITKCTNFIVKPLRRLIPNIGRLEIATILLICLIACLQYILLSFLLLNTFSIAAILLLAAGDILRLVINIFFYAILLSVILNWLQPASPFNYTLQQFTAPIMYPLQRIIKPIGNIDISPLIAIILLQLLSIILVTPLLAKGGMHLLGG